LCGLKGKRVGDATVSSLHANFLLNAGNARCRDIIQLRDMIQKEVFRSFSVELQPEVIIKDE
jgi:UDP-N-acetylmuramate dehydrogenase